MTDYFPETESAAPASSTPSAVPHSREAEEAVVGAVLINPEVYYDVAQFLAPDDFYIHRNKWIWEAFTRLHEQRIPVDLLTLSEELDRSNLLADVGGQLAAALLRRELDRRRDALDDRRQVTRGHERLHPLLGGGEQQE